MNSMISPQSAAFAVYRLKNDITRGTKNYKKRKIRNE